MIKKTHTLICLMALCSLMATGQTSGVVTYDFTDGVIIENGQSDDGLLTLSGTYSYHSSSYGLNMINNSEIDIAVDGKSTFMFLGSEYSSLNMAGTVAEEGDLGTQNTAVENDLADTYGFVYDGEAATVTFKATGDGSDVYLPQIEVIPPQNGADTVVAVENIIYYFDLRDGSIIPNSTDLNGNYTIEEGLFKIDCDPNNAYGYNGPDHGSILKSGNVVALKVAGNSKIKVAGCQYSNGTVTLSSDAGAFDVDTQSLQTSECYKNDGSTVDFIYVGEAGEVVLTFDGTNYVAMIEVVPVTYEIGLDSWVQKSGSITINGTEINYTTGESLSESPVVEVSDGVVVSSTTEMASLRIDLAGNALSSFTPELSGDVASVEISGDTLYVKFADENSDPKSYTFLIKDNSVEVKAEAGKTYTYNFADGSTLPQTGYKSMRYSIFVADDGILTMNSNSDEESLQFGYHDSSHGAVMFSGNSIDFVVAGNATITFGTCQYGSADDAIFQFTDAEGVVPGQTDAHNIGTGACGTNSFTYAGDAGVITATLISEEYPAAEVYIHGVTIENAAEIVSGNGKIDVWDFGAEQLNESKYNNKLNEEIINSWYDTSIEGGTSGHTLPDFSAGVLSWVGGGNDRLRTLNTNLTRYDENISGDEGYTGRLYVNSGANTGRYLSLTLSEDDEVTIVALSQRGSGRINFQYVGDPDAQTDVAEVPAELAEFTFVAEYEGTYHIFDDQDKPSYYRIYRKDADYVELTGNVDVSAAEDIPEGYAIQFTNEAGKVWKAEMDGQSYRVTIPAGYSYELSIYNANGYIISNEKTTEVTEETVNHDVNIVKVELYTLTGLVAGLGDEIENLSLSFRPDESAGKIFIPEPVVDYETSAYSVELEPDCEYIISAQGVNDFYLPENVIAIGNADTTIDIVFETKPVYKVVIDSEDLTADQKEKLGLEFINLNDEGYTYRFEYIDNIALRDGVYSIDYFGLDDYPVKLGLTSNLKINGSEVSKMLTFKPIKHWSFDDKDIESGTVAYNGMIFSGQIKNEVNKGHISGKEGDVIKVPVSAGDKVRITYYYSADFSIEGGESYTTTSGSTSTFEYAEYNYPESEDGYVTITIGSEAGTTYITDILVAEAVEFQEVLEVGEDKDYQTINDALEVVREMVRENDERVTIAIDPGNYEEMIDVDVPNVTFKNAALSPGIALQNEGVDIADGAVRITSYYGHGYHYYSMEDNQRWDAEVLRVNEENGYISYENVGAGTTNGSFWNATVVVSADGFRAEHIIFENSFNQYISKKESEDIVVMWASGSRGERPVDYGNTSVQNKSFVERAAAIAVTNNTDKVVLMNCRAVGHQDTFFGGYNCRVVVYKGSVMGGTDYLFGGMTAVFYKTDLAMNTSDDSDDRSYITAAQQEGDRGYLMYECIVTSAEPGVETASQYRSKPGYYGRPWQPTTSEVVFYNTTVETTDYSGSEGKSLIAPVGWLSTLGGESEMMYEYGTVELSGEDNMSERASWSTILNEPVLNDGTEITTYNFTKGNDGWDPISELIANDDGADVRVFESLASVKVYSYNGQLYVSNVKSDARIDIFNINGKLMRRIKTNEDVNFSIDKGLWIIKVQAEDGQKLIKVASY